MEEIQRTVYEDFIIEQRQIGNISLGRAADLLGINYNEFFDLLGKNGLSYINANEGEMDESYRQFREVLKNNNK